MNKSYNKVCKKQTGEKVQNSSMYGTLGGDTDCDSKDYKIGVVGKKNTYGDGAIRYIKDKGRFDLIPEDVVPRICYKLDDLLLKHYCFNYSSENILLTAYDRDFLTAIILLTMKYFNEADKAEFDGNVVEEHNDVCFNLFIPYFCKMLQDLAKHFQKGAAVYGERNCQQGIPTDSFIDSGLRHLGQHLIGVVDEENHLISAIWNFWMYDWTINQKKNVIKPMQFTLYDPHRTPKTEPTESNPDVQNKVNSAVEFYIKANTDEAQTMLKRASDSMAACMSLPMDKLSILFDVLRTNEISVCHEYDDLRYGKGHKCNKFNTPIQLKPNSKRGLRILELYSDLIKAEISTNLNNFIRSHGTLLIPKYLSELNMSIVFDKVDVVATDVDEKVSKDDALKGVYSNISKDCGLYYNLDGTLAEVGQFHFRDKETTNKIAEVISKCKSAYLKPFLDKLENIECESEKTHMEKVISEISKAVDNVTEKMIQDLPNQQIQNPVLNLDLSWIDNLPELTNFKKFKESIENDEDGEIIEV